MEQTIYEKRHRELMMPVVRVNAKQAIGSGTVIYSGKNKEGEYSSYVLTNFHVVEKNVELKDQWSSVLQRNVKRDIKSIADVDFFRYRWASRGIGATTIQADIIAYDRDEDLALLKLRDGTKVEAVAKLYPRGEEHLLRATMPVYCVGAGLGGYPVITEGMLSQFGEIIENREFWLESAAAIFGNSGGALFLADTHSLIGVPSRIAVTWGQAIPHLMYAIPITRIYGFLEDQRCRFVYDSQYTEESESEERERMRESADRRQLLEGEPPTEKKQEWRAG